MFRDMRRKRQAMSKEECGQYYIEKRPGCWPYMGTRDIPMRCL